jgi:cytochrome b558/566 subunit A
MVRSFTTSDATRYRLQISANSTYYVAFAVWQGKLGESSDFKSVSQWYTITVSNKAPLGSVTTAPSGQVNAPLAAAVAVGTLITGLVIGIIVRSRPQRSRS